MINGINTSGLAAVLAVAISATSCGTSQKLRDIQKTEMKAGLSLPDQNRAAPPEFTLPDTPRDTLRIVDFEGHRTLIMNAVRDVDGEMVATDRLAASYITARFLNVAERNGKVDIEFQVHVPERMMDSKWQLRLEPDMFLPGDSLRLDPVYITGSRYRKAQLRGYEQYRRFLSSIVTDTTLFINKHDLEVFLERNIPKLYALKNDSTFVSDEAFASMYGVTEQEAVRHYTYGFLVRRNKRRIMMKGAMFRKYVKSPIVSEGIRLDTVIRDPDGGFAYNYIQTVNTTPELKKVDICISGEIREQDKQLYTIPRSEPLTFYISSLSSLADNTEKYLKKVISRRVEANTACYIEFRQGKAAIDPELGHNPEEIGRIKNNIRSLIANEEFELDSITIAAFASPEGAVRANDYLSEKRAASAGEYFGKFAAAVRDSVMKDAGAFISLDESRPTGPEIPRIFFNSRSGGENWGMLDALVEQDPLLAQSVKDYYRETAEKHKDLDAREKALTASSSYKYMREHLYPRLRIVKFDFFLHRKGMLRDTIHTTEPDTAYMRGVQCIRDREYKNALKLLRPYSDYNTAVALIALDRNTSAMEILSGLPKNARTDYLKAIVYSRQGDERSAVEHYIHACSQDGSFIHRGRLDPEISELIKKYDLNSDM
ncbi:MAG: hypothetical protein IJU68_04920 [Bacteroidales bacterium]|nr:hypothetical protein [Bacteroidales bacterium]